MLYEWAPRAGVLARIYKCQCDEPLCRSVVLAFGLAEGDAWFASMVGVARTDVELPITWWLDLVEQVEEPDVDLGERVCMLLGSPWRALVSNELAFAQMDRVVNAPSWFEQELLAGDIGEVRELARWLIGGEQSVARALLTLHAYRANKLPAHAHPDRPVVGFSWRR